MRDPDDSRAGGLGDPEHRADVARVAQAIQPDRKDACCHVGPGHVSAPNHGEGTDALRGLGLDGAVQQRAGYLEALRNPVDMVQPSLE